jgi:DNA replication protein DnaC
MKACSYCRQDCPDDSTHCVHPECFEGRWYEVCWPRYRNTDRAKLPNQEAVTQLLTYNYSDRGLFVAGPTRRGKTRAIFLLLRRLFEEGHRIVALDCLDFGHRIADLFLNGEGVAWVRSLSKVPMLFMDDIDKGKLTERVESELFGLFERRIANCLPTIISANSSGKALTSRMDPIRGPAFLGRLEEFTDLILF